MSHGKNFGGCVLVCAVVALFGAPRLVTAQDGGIESRAAESRAAESRATESRPVEPPFARRIGGDMVVAAERLERGGEIEWRAGKSRISTALPVGYPDPTPPGAVDLKRYPAVRRAEVTRTDGADAGRNMAFWPLFQHIEKNGIAMTSPVEMDYAPKKAGQNPLADESWTMSFLYRKPDMGKTGTDGKVVVADKAGLLYISLGMRGGYTRKAVDLGVETLRAWLKEQTEWEEDGPPRSLYYNGPEARNGDKWAEVQLPVRPRAKP